MFYITFPGLYAEDYLSMFLRPRPVTKIACGFFKSNRVNVRILNVALDTLYS